MADESLTSFQLSICGLAAGTCAKAVCHPLDVVKKRFQVWTLIFKLCFACPSECHYECTFARFLFIFDLSIRRV